MPTPPATAAISPITCIRLPTKMRTYGDARVGQDTLQGTVRRDWPAGRDEALHPDAETYARRASEADRASPPWGRVEADARLRPRRLRQDDAAGRVADGLSDR